MQFNRSISSEFQHRLTQYPVVTVTGPRQSGKTTLVKKICSEYPYVNLEKPDVRIFATEDPNGFLAQYPDGAIFDEVQNVPSLLSYIQVIVDEKQKMGQYILTGSHQLALHDALAQSLAGRTTLLHLLPLSFSELQSENIALSAEEYMVQGFYPRIYRDTINPNTYYSDYVKTYLERDVRQIVNVKNLILFQKFMRLCAGRSATILNMHELSKDVGVSHHTIREWLSILQASYLIDFIPPYFENFGKRVIKSPKLYFTDVGLLSYLLGIETVTQISRDPLRGQLYETMVVMELMKARFNVGKDANLFFYRDSEKKEVDIIYKRGTALLPIEIKSSQTFSPDFIKGIRYFKNLIGDRCEKSYVIYAGEDKKNFQETEIRNHQYTEKVLVDER